MKKRGNHINDVARSPFDGTPCLGPLRSVPVMFQPMKSMTGDQNDRCCDICHIVSY